MQRVWGALQNVGRGEMTQVVAGGVFTAIGECVSWGGSLVGCCKTGCGCCRKMDGDAVFRLSVLLQALASVVAATSATGRGFAEMGRQ